MKTIYCCRLIPGALLIALVLVVFCAPSVFAQGESLPWAPWSDEIPPMLPVALAAEATHTIDEDATPYDPGCGMAQVAPEYGTNPPADWAITAFASIRDDNWEIYAAKGDGSGQRRITWSEAADLRPRISPDGKWIVFDSDDEVDRGREILVVPYAGGGVTTLVDTNTPKGAEVIASDFAPAWSKDGKRVAFVSTRDGNPEIYEVEVATGIQRRVTFNDLPDYDPAYNKKSGELYWARAVDAYTGVVYGMRNGVEETLSWHIPVLERPLFAGDGVRLGYMGDVTGDGWGDIVVPKRDGTANPVYMSQQVDWSARVMQLDAEASVYIPEEMAGNPDLVALPMGIGTEWGYTRVRGTWYVTSARLVSWYYPYCAFPNQLEQTPDAFGDIISLDREPPSFGLGSTPGWGTPGQVSTLLLGKDAPGGSGVSLYEVVSDSTRNGHEVTTSAGYLENPNYTCGAFSFKVRAVDFMGFASPWVASSNVEYPRVVPVAVRDLWGAPLGGMQVVHADEHLTEKAERFFGKRITGADGRTTHYDCGFSDLEFSVANVHVLNPGWEQVGLTGFPDNSQANMQLEPPVSARILSESFTGTPAELKAAWNLDFTPIQCDKDDVGQYYEPGTDCLTLIRPITTGHQPVHIVRAERSVSVPPAMATSEIALVVRQMTQNLLVYQPMLYVSTSETPTKTLVAGDGTAPVWLTDFNVIPLEMAIGDAITVTYEIADGPETGNTYVILDRVDIIPRYSPIIDGFSPTETVGAATEAEIGASTVLTITGENFLEPVAVDLDGVTSAGVEFVDSQTLRVTFASIPPGVHTLWVTNRAGRPEQTRVAAEVRIVQGSQIYMPLLNNRGYTFALP